jgi:hypothetical protein
MIDKQKLVSWLMAQAENSKRLQQMYQRQQRHGLVKLHSNRKLIFQDLIGRLHNGEFDTDSHGRVVDIHKPMNFDVLDETGKLAEELCQQLIKR